MSRVTQTLILVLRNNSLPSVTPYAQSIEFAQSEDGRAPFSCMNADGSAANCSGGSFVFTARSSYLSGSIAIEINGVETDYSVGTGYFPFSATNTALPVQDYDFDVFFIDAMLQRWQVAPVSNLTIGEAII